MTRVKRGTTSLRKRRSILSRVKGARSGIKNKEKKANEILKHAGNHAFQDRRKRKGVFSRLWNVRINAAVRPHDISYSQFMNSMKKKNISVNKKMLSTMAQYDKTTFEAFVKEVLK